MYRQQKRSWVKHLDFTILDLLSLTLALVISYAWRFDGGWIFYDDIWERMYIATFLIDIVVVFFTESYSGILRRDKFQEVVATIKHCIIVWAGSLIYLYATKTSVAYSRQLIFVFVILFIAISYIFRVILKRWVRRQKLKDLNKNIMIVVAERSTIEQCLHEIAHNRYTEFKVTGAVVVDADMKGQEVQGIPIICNADEFLDYVRTNVVDEVFIDGNTRTSTEALGRELMELGILVHMSLIHSKQLMPNRVLENYGNYMVLTTSMRYATNRQMVLKRAMDIVGAIVGLFFTLIIFLIFAPVIKIQSPGPVFYQSVRIGKNGRRFRFYKFRTMYVGADQMLADLMEQNEMSGYMFKMENDPRIIPIGHFLRKYSLDEFPQFWNVLKGDMSLVGTRPPTEEEFENYEYHHKARLAIKPGLTGMWQANGRSEITDFEEVVRLDTEYITNWSIGLDIKILFKTVGVVFTGKGSK